MLGVGSQRFVFWVYSYALVRYMHTAQYSEALPLLTEQLETLRSQTVRDEITSVLEHMM
eukprot:COSAG01_NODE_26881_length_700_cov_1.186356_1_plen_59_part_00